MAPRCAAFFVLVLSVSSDVAGAHTALYARTTEVDSTGDSHEIKLAPEQLTGTGASGRLVRADVTRSGGVKSVKHIHQRQGGNLKDPKVHEQNLEKASIEPMTMSPRMPADIRQLPNGAGRSGSLVRAEVIGSGGIRAVGQTHQNLGDDFDDPEVQEHNLENVSTEPKTMSPHMPPDVPEQANGTGTSGSFVHADDLRYIKGLTLDRIRTRKAVERTDGQSGDDIENSEGHLEYTTWRRRKLWAARWPDCPTSLDSRRRCRGCRRRCLGQDWGVKYSGVGYWWNPSCQDTPGWVNGHGLNCASYDEKYCVIGRFKPGQEWAGNKTRFNDPAGNCCVCGKGNALATAFWATTTTTTCQDTPGWVNGHGLNCASYAEHYCSGGKFNPFQEWAGDKTRFNDPAGNCCVCGKRASSSLLEDGERDLEEDDETAE